MVNRIILLLDIILIITTVIMLCITNSSDNIGLAALEDAGKYMVYLIALATELIILVITVIITVYKKYH